GGHVPGRGGAGRRRVLRGGRAVADPAAHLRPGLRERGGGPGRAGGAAGPGRAWEAIQPDVGERGVLPQAAALNGLNMNVARAVGPAIGGLVVAAVGAGWVFALNAISFVGIAAVIGMWRPPERAATGPRERLVEALRSGGRY